MNYLVYFACIACIINDNNNESLNLTQVISCTLKLLTLNLLKDSSALHPNITLEIIEGSEHHKFELYNILQKYKIKLCITKLCDGSKVLSLVHPFS